MNGRLFYRIGFQFQNKKQADAVERPSPAYLLHAAEIDEKTIIIYRCSRSIKYFNLLPWSVIASGGRNQRAKFGQCVKYIPRYRPAYLKTVLRYTGEWSEQSRSNLEGMYKMLSTIACSNLVHFCWAVPEILDREIWEIVNKMAAGGRTEVASDVQFGM